MRKRCSRSLYVILLATSLGWVSASFADSFDYYEALGVPRSASKKEIDDAYRKLWRSKFETEGDEAERRAKFQKVQNAYDTLSDPEKRVAYDHLRILNESISVPQGSKVYQERYYGLKTSLLTLRSKGVNPTDAFILAVSTELHNLAGLRGQEVYETQRDEYLRALDDFIVENQNWISPNNPVKRVAIISVVHDRAKFVSLVKKFASKDLKDLRYFSRYVLEDIKTEFENPEQRIQRIQHRIEDLASAGRFTKKESANIYFNYVKKEFGGDPRFAESFRRSNLSVTGYCIYASTMKALFGRP